MKRAFIMVLDSVGIGGAADAAAYGDTGANTVGHIAQACAEGLADRPGLRSGPLKVPHLCAMGLGAALEQSSGLRVPGFDTDADTPWGVGYESSRGKDTPSGHWEIAGVPVEFDWTVFPDTQPAFPVDVTQALIKQANLPGILGNCHASGTRIMADLGAEHVRSGMPICYTSADSVFQIAAHEQSFGLERLIQVCTIARRILDPINIGRVIARPFEGDAATGFKRTGNRRDLSVPPPAPTLLDHAEKAGRHIITMGKIGDIFAHRGVGDVRKAYGNMPLMDKTLNAMSDLQPGGLLFANFVDFDSEYGHTRDVPGYAGALEAFDARLPEVFDRMREGDLLILTADHGNDPTWRGTDHTREHVPVLVRLSGYNAATPLGLRKFSDMGASVAAHLGLAYGPHGQSFLELMEVSQ